MPSLARLGENLAALFAHKPTGDRKTVLAHF
jgi:hypothetical protein